MNDTPLIEKILKIINSNNIEEIKEKYKSLNKLITNYQMLDSSKFKKEKYGLTLIHETVRRILYDCAVKNSYFENPSDILYYAKFMFSNLKEEKFYTLHLDKKGYLMHIMFHNSGTINKVSIHPREILKKILHYEVKPFGIIMLHNHPSGNPSPSDHDIQVTVKMRKLLRASGIELIEHIIVAREGFVLMIRNGELKNFF